MKTEATPAVTPSPTTVNIQIKGTNFLPAAVQCESGTILRWVVRPEKESNSHSLYYGSTRGHVLGFEDLPLESSYLSANQSFELTIYKPGVYRYRCLIFPSMSGAVEVVPRRDGTAEDLSNPRVFSVPEPIESSKEVDSSEEDGTKIKEIVEKYLHKAQRNLEPSVELDIASGSAEHEGTGGESTEEENEIGEKCKELFSDQHPIFRELVSMNFECMWKKVEEMDKSKSNAQLEVEYAERKHIISSCMNMH